MIYATKISTLPSDITSTTPVATLPSSSTTDETPTLTTIPEEATPTSTRLSASLGPSTSGNALPTDPFDGPGFTTIAPPQDISRGLETSTVTSASTQESDSVTTSIEAMVTSGAGAEPSTSAESDPSSNLFDGPGFMTIAPPSNIRTGSLSATSTSTIESSVISTSQLSTSEYLATDAPTPPGPITSVDSDATTVPTGTPTLGPGFSFIPFPGGEMESSSSTDMPSSTSTPPPADVPPEIPGGMDTTVMRSPLSTTVSTLSSSNPLPSLETTSEALLPSGTSAPMASSPGVVDTTGLPVSSGIPDLVLPSSVPDAYAPDPTGGPEVSSVPVSQSEPASTVDTSSPSSSTSDAPLPTSEGSTPTVTSSEASQPTASVIPGGPDLVIPTTTSDSFGTDAPGGRDPQATTASISSTSSVTSSEETSSAQVPTTVFVTVVVPTAPTATVTETVYPSLSTVTAEPSAPATTASTDNGDIIDPTRAVGPPPELILPTSAAESYKPAPTGSASPTFARSTTTILELVTRTQTDSVVVTRYTTLASTAAGVIPVPTDSDVLTTVFETQTAPAIVTSAPSLDASSNAPEFGNVISVTFTASYPVPLLPFPAGPSKPGGDDEDNGNGGIYTTIQMTTTYQRVGVSTPVSAPFTYIASTIDYPGPGADSPTTTATTSAVISTRPVRDGFVIPTGGLVISRRDVGGAQGVAIPEPTTSLTTLSTVKASGTDRAVPTGKGVGYAPTMRTNVERALAVPASLQAGSGAHQGQMSFGLLAVVFLVGIVAERMMV
ncbi:hypothetical protein DRE_06634 [Drechslerella stenobrocha 248]|uniref:Uncharacterized protein n=1 Tax=Drechslerella stenobrocha 248 TaxID=1043628 RepID=W7I6W0_9PEZI|nr:hypothetical protein DRE_06634 [Drechslerella stenobrocha 248]